MAPVANVAPSFAFTAGAAGSLAADPGLTIVASDAFSRVLAAGWGTADVGGFWQTNSGEPTIFRVDGARGLIVLPNANPRIATLSDVNVVNGVGLASFSMERAPDSPSGGYSVQLYCRRRDTPSVGDNYYRFRVRAFGSGKMDLRVEKNVNGVSTWVFDNTGIPVTWQPAAKYWVRWECSGVSPATALRIRVWSDAASEPSTWPISTTVDEPVLDEGGTVGFRVSGPTASQVNFPLTVALDDLEYATPAEPNVAPIANSGGPYAGTVGAEIAFDGTASFDPDNDLPLSYAWDFGDGATGTGPTSSHAYASAGAYTATLTVSDSRGLASEPSSATVTIDGGGPDFLVRDRFSRVVTRGWGSPEVGGFWNMRSGSSTLFQVDGEQARITLIDVKAHNIVATEGYGVDVTGLISFSTDIRPDLPGRFHTVQVYARRNDLVSDGDNYYRYRVRLFNDGRMDLRVEKNVEAVPTWITEIVSSSVVWVPGSKYWMRWEAVGVSPATAIRMKVWRDGTSEPTAWPIDRTVSEPALDFGGTTGVRVSPPSDQTTFPIQHAFDDLEYRIKR